MGMFVLIFYNFISVRSLFSEIITIKSLMWKSLNLELSAPTDFALTEVFF